MASNINFIEDALTKQVSESAVNAIVGSLESHLASSNQAVDSQNADQNVQNILRGAGLVNHNHGGETVTAVVNAQLNSRARVNGPALIRTAGGGQILQAVPIRQQNLQLSTNSALNMRGRAPLSSSGQQQQQLPGATISATAGQGGSSLVIGSNQIRVSQPGQSSGLGPGQGGQHFLVKTENGGYQLVRLANATGQSVLWLSI
jgi:hypothetical protein